MYGIGIANKKNYNDNTSGVLLLLYLMHNLQRQDVAFIFFDNEEKGLLGSIAIAKYLKANFKTYNTYQKIFINFDCIGRGDVVGLVATNGGKKVASDLIALNTDEKLNYQMRKFSKLELSDHFSFRGFNSLGVMCYNKKGKKLILNNIHSHSDNYINLKQIESIANTFIKYLNRDDEVNG